MWGVPGHALPAAYLNDDIEGARQALEETREPLQQMTQAGGEQPQGQQQAQAGGQQEAVPQQGQDVGEADLESVQEQGGQQAVQAGGQQEQERPAQQAQPAEQEQVAVTEQPAGQEQPQATGENPLAAMPASDVIGTEVQNREGETVAEIVDLVKQQGADEIYAVLSVGGFLGIGDKEVLVPLDELEVGQEGEVVMANASEDQLREMPQYEEEGYESMAGLGEEPAQQPQQ